MITERQGGRHPLAETWQSRAASGEHLQYYFSSREDLLVAAFRHASSAEIAALEAEVAGLDDPWDQLEKIITTSLTGYAPDAPGGGRLWVESWHFGLRDAEMLAPTRSATTPPGGSWWRASCRRGMRARGLQQPVHPNTIAVLAVAAADGMGIPLSLGDPGDNRPRRRARRAGRTARTARSITVRPPIGSEFFVSNAYHSGQAT